MHEPQVHLDLVAVHFSTRCGSVCAFCYASQQLKERIPPTPLKEISRILRKLAAEEVREILFVGGDPLVHPHFLESVRLSKELGLTTSVLSNSWAFRPNQDVAEILSYIDFCEATILGATGETHDALTGVDKSFVRLISNLRRIADHGKSIGICVNAMPQTMREIYDMVARIRGEFTIPVRSLMIQRIVPSGAAAGNVRFGLNLDDVELLMKQVDRVSTEFGVRIQFEDPVPWCTVNPIYHKYLARCEWGYTRGSISSTGLLNRCGADDQYRLGSIWDGNVQTIWQNHPILQSFRSKNYLPNECRDCVMLSKCGGGCPLSCGTLKDHAVDQLYFQKIQKDSTGTFAVTAPSDLRFPQRAIRFAYEGDLDLIVKLEGIIFGDSFPVFGCDNIRTYFNRCPQAFRIARAGDELLGYSIVFPLNQGGLNEINTNAPESVVKMDPQGIDHRFGKNTRAIYLEVIAIRESASLGARIALLKDLISIMRSAHVPVFTCPITKIGKLFARRVGFVPVANDCKLGHTLLVKPAPNVAGVPMVFQKREGGGDDGGNR